LIRAVITATFSTYRMLEHALIDEYKYIVAIENAFDAYWDNIYPHLQEQMIEANHRAGVIQRTWKRCVMDPSHPACRRRLEFEFNDLMTTSGF